PPRPPPPQSPTPPPAPFRPRPRCTRRDPRPSPPGPRGRASRRSSAPRRREPPGALRGWRGCPKAPPTARDSSERRPEFFVDAIEQAVDEPARLLGAELLGDLDGLVDRD